VVENTAAKLFAFKSYGVRDISVYESSTNILMMGNFIPISMKEKNKAENSKPLERPGQS